MGLHAVIANSRRQIEKSHLRADSYFSDDDIAELTSLRAFGEGGILWQIKSPHVDAVVDHGELAASIQKLTGLLQNEPVAPAPMQRLLQTLKAAAAKNASVYFQAD